MSGDSDLDYSIDSVTDLQQVIDWKLPGQMEYIESAVFYNDFQMGRDRMQMFLESVIRSSDADERVHRCAVATKVVGDFDRKLLGFATCSTFSTINGKPFMSLIISRVAVLAQYQRKGIGTSLLNRCVHFAEEISSCSFNEPYTAIIGVKTEEQKTLFSQMGWSKVINLETNILKSKVTWVTQSDY